MIYKPSGSPARSPRAVVVWLFVSLAACSTPDRATPPGATAPPAPAPSAPAPVAAPPPEDGPETSTPAGDGRIDEARRAIRRLGDAICACRDEPCARRPLSDHLMWEGSLLLKDGTEEGRAQIRAVQTDPQVEAQQARIDACTRRIRAAPPVAARAAAAWLHAVAQRDAAGVVAASTPGLWVRGWDAGCEASTVQAVAACVVEAAALARALARHVETPDSDLDAERVGSRVGRPLPGWARHTPLDALGADHDLVRLLLSGDPDIFHHLLLAVTPAGKVAAVVWFEERD